MAFTYTFYICKWKKNKKLKKLLSKKPKDKWSSHVTGKRFLNIGTEEQQNYYEQCGKESISELRIKIIESYVRCLTQRNLKVPKVC